MFIWNRVELLTTLSMEYYLRARTLLQQNGIKIQSKQIPVREDVRKGGMLQRPTEQYRIYVHKEDMERAQEVLSQLGAQEQHVYNALEW